MSWFSKRPRPIPASTRLKDELGPLIDARMLELSVCSAALNDAVALLARIQTEPMTIDEIRRNIAAWAAIHKPPLLALHARRLQGATP